MFRATLAKGSAIFPYTPQELTDLTEAIDALPERGVWFSRDLEVLPPTLEQAARVLEQFQARALAGHATSTLHGTAAPGGGAHPRPVMTVRELLRRVPGLLQADPATVLAVVGSPLNAYWPGSNVDAAAVLETLQTGLDQIRLASPDGPGHKLLLGPGPRGTNNETIYFNRHPDAEDLNELLDSFPCLDALIPASHDSNQDEDQRDAAPPSFVSLKTHIGDNAIAAYLLDIRKVIADHGGCASKAAAKFADLEETGRSPLHGTCAQDVVACIRDHGSVGVPTDQVEQVRDALVAELTSSKHALYGLSTPPTPAQARDYAKQWISDTGYPISLTQFA